MFLYIFLVFSVLFMGFMLYLIKTAPYGYEGEDGFHVFDKLEDMESYIASLKNSEKGLGQEYKNANAA